MKKTQNFKYSTIVKSNTLIKSSMFFTPNEYKLINFLISKIKTTDTELPVIEISVSELNEKCFNVTSGQSSYTFVKKYAKALICKFFTINENKNYTFFSMTDSTEGILKVVFNPEIKKYLIKNDGDFTKFNYKNIYKLSSFYAMRLYEILKSFQGLKFKNFNIDDLKSMLGSSNRYKNFYNFNKKILEIALKEINECTDIYVNLETIKLARTVVSIDFYIKENSKNLVKDKIEVDEIKDLNKKFEKITGILLNENILKGLIKKKGFKYVEGYVIDFKKFLDTQNMDDVRKFFASAVKHGYTPNDENIPNKVYNSSSKPEQSTNFEQREYDDEFFESLYDNF